MPSLSSLCVKFGKALSGTGLWGLLNGCSLQAVSVNDLGWALDISVLSLSSFILLTSTKGIIAGSHLSTVGLVIEKQTSRVIIAVRDYPLPKRRDQEKWCHQSLEEEQCKETDKGDRYCHTTAACLVPTHLSLISLISGSGSRCSWGSPGNSL